MPNAQRQSDGHEPEEPTNTGSLSELASAAETMTSVQGSKHARQVTLAFNLTSCVCPWCAILTRKMVGRFERDPCVSSLYNCTQAEPLAVQAAQTNKSR